MEQISPNWINCLVPFCWGRYDLQLLAREPSRAAASELSEPSSHLSISKPQLIEESTDLGMGRLTVRRTQGSTSMVDVSNNF